MTKPLFTPPIDKGVNFLKSSPKSSYSSVDWLTVTTDKKAVGNSWADVFASIANENGYEFTKPWSFWGFEGWQTNHCRYGVRFTTEEYILIVSSAPADLVWRDICPTARSITRVDLAVTTELEEVHPGLPQDYYRITVPPGGPSKLKYSLVQNSNGGQTLYVGSRHSEQFGRVYDKGAERRGTPGKTYRYEVVLRKDVAPNLVKSLLASASVAGSKEALSSQITSFVWDWFDNREVVPIFERLGDFSSHIEVEATLTTTDRKLQWLKKSISPTVRKLMAMGRTQEVIEALSLEGFMGIEQGDRPPEFLA